jgi:hypothetical protein
MEGAPYIGMLNFFSLDLNNIISLLHHYVSVLSTSLLGIKIIWSDNFVFSFPGQPIRDTQIQLDYCYLEMHIKATKIAMVCTVFFCLYLYYIYSTRSKVYFHP